MQTHTQSAGTIPGHQGQAEAHTALGPYTSDWTTTALPAGGRNTTGTPELIAVDRGGGKPPNINVGTQLISQH